MGPKGKFVFPDFKTKGAGFVNACDTSRPVDLAQEVRYTRSDPCACVPVHVLEQVTIAEDTWSR